jgi:hypothetical protein
MYTGLCTHETVPAIDVECTAQKLLRVHGQDAPLVARRWAECATKAGDRQRAAACRRVVQLVSKRRRPPNFATAS